MNYAMVIRVPGMLLIIEAILMIPSLTVALIYNDPKDAKSFAITMVAALLSGVLMTRFKGEDKKVRAKEGMTIVVLGWILVSLFGCLPFIISGSIPTFTDAFFESVSGFTTTGATILDKVEGLPKGILFWRSFTHWIGGMGILVFTLALLPNLGVGGLQIYKAEATGPTTEKILPRMKDTAKVLYGTYLVITLLQLFLLLAGGMTLYDACIHSFGTVGTGGFSSRQDSIGHYKSTYIHVVIGVFMMLSGINFSLYFALAKGRWKTILKDQELKLYLGIIAFSTLFIGLDLFLKKASSAGISLRDAYFQVSSIITTTGYATVDFNRWSSFSKLILIALMFVGGCAGSTAGGIKNIRILVLLKLIRREAAKIFHPRAVVSIKIGEKTVGEDTILGIVSFFFLYILIFFAGTLIVSLGGTDIITAGSAVAATLGNIGPGLAGVGPTRSFSGFSQGTTWLLSLLMLLGRLELFTLVAVIMPRKWHGN